MYWPIGTPRIYAATSDRPADSHHSVSHDGLPAPGHPGNAGDQAPGGSSLLSPTSPVAQDSLGPPLTPATPATPLTPAIKSVEYSEQYDGVLDHSSGGPAPSVIPPRTPILALQAARSGHIFAVITATSINLWQTKVYPPSPPFTACFSDTRAHPAHGIARCRRTVRSLYQVLWHQYQPIATARLCHSCHPHKPGLPDHLHCRHRRKIPSLQAALQ